MLRLIGHYTLWLLIITAAGTFLYFLITIAIRQEKTRTKRVELMDRLNRLKNKLENGR